MRLTIAMRSGTLVEPDCRAGETNMRGLKHPGGAPVRPAGLIWRHGGLVRRASHGLSADAHPAASESGPWARSGRAPTTHADRSRTPWRTGRLALVCGSVTAIGMLLALVVPAVGQQKTLIVAGYGGSFEQTMRKEVFPDFEAKHGVKIEYVAGNSTDTIAKLQAQKGNQQIDVAIVDDGPMYQAVQLGFCRELAKAPVYDDVYDVMKFASNKAVGIGMVGTGIMYAKKVFADNKWPAPTSWEDLKDPKFAKKLVVPPLNNSYGLHTLVMMARLRGGGEKKIDPGFKAVKEEIGPNVLVYEPSPGK